MSGGWRHELPALLRIAGPLAGAQLGYMVMATTDTVMMGKLGTDAIAAGGLSSAIGMLLVYVALGLLQSIQPIVARGRGADDPRSFARTLAAGVAASLLWTGPIVLVLIELEAILTTAGAPPAIAHLAATYARTFAWAVPGLLLAGTLRNYVTALGRTGFVMAVSVLALGMNLLLNWMLIFGRLGAPALGLPGSGTATALVAWAMATALAIHIRHAKLLPVMPMSLAELWHGLCEVTALGVPIAGVWLLEIGMFSASSLLMGRFGPVALAAHQICINLVSLTFTVPSAISTAATVRLGFHMGARAPAEARVAAGAALAIGVAFMALVAIALNLFARPIIRLYLAADDPALPQVLSLGTGMLTVAALFQVFDATQCVAAGALRGLLDVRMPLLIGVVGYWLLGLPIGAALAFATPLGPIGLWCGLAAGLVLVAAMLATRLRRRMGALSAQLPPAASGLGALAKP